MYELDSLDVLECQIGTSKRHSNTARDPLDVQSSRKAGGLLVPRLLLLLGDFA